MTRRRGDANANDLWERIEGEDDALDVFYHLSHEPALGGIRGEASIAQQYIDLKLHVHLHARLRPRLPADESYKFRAIFATMRCAKDHPHEIDAAVRDFEIPADVFLIETDHNTGEVHQPMLVAYVDFMDDPKQIVRSAVWLHGLDECPLLFREMPDPMTVEIPLLQGDGEACFRRVWSFGCAAQMVNSGVQGRTEVVREFINREAPIRGWEPYSLVSVHPRGQLVQRWIRSIHILLGAEFVGLACDESIDATLEHIQFATCRAEFQIDARRGFHSGEIVPPRRPGPPY